MIAGGAALQRSDQGIALSKAIAAEVELLGRQHRRHRERSIAAASHASRDGPGASDLTPAHRAVQGQDSRPPRADHIVKRTRKLTVEISAERERAALGNGTEPTRLHVVCCKAETTCAQRAIAIDRDVRHKRERLASIAVQGRAPVSIDIAVQVLTRSASGKHQTRP